MSEVQRISEMYDYDAGQHQYRAWWDHHLDLLRHTGDERRNPMIITNGNPALVSRPGMTLRGWLNNRERAA